MYYIYFYTIYIYNIYIYTIYNYIYTIYIVLYTDVYTYGKNLGSRPITKSIKIPRPPQMGRPLLVMKVLCLSPHV